MLPPSPLQRDSSNNTYPNTEKNAVHLEQRKFKNATKKNASKRIKISPKRFLVSVANFPSSLYSKAQLSYARQLN